MKHIVWGLIGLAFVTNTRADETLATSAATLELSNPHCEITPQLFTTEWQWQRASGGLTRNADGSFAFTITLASAPAVHGRATFSPTADGAVDACYTFTPERDVTLNALYVGATLPTDAWAGGSFNAENGTPDNHGRLPSDYGQMTVFSRTVRALVLWPKGSTERLSFAFPEPTPAMIQDDRQWGPTFSVRVGHIGGPRTFKAGDPFTVRFTLATKEPQRLVLDEPATIQAGPDWIPLKPEPEILAGSALDFSGFRSTGLPAGRYGHVVARGPHFEFEDRPGVPQRFYGVNMCFSANFLEPDEAALIAARLARTGYNAIRLHHHDGGLVEGSADGTTLNPANLAKLDALIAACVSNGLYVTTDLYVSRPVPWRSVGIARDETIPMNTFKVLVPVHEGAWENFKAFARQFLTHTNPYTGRRYADEPALAWLAMINEGNFGNYLDEMRDIPEWRQAWEKWLRARQAAEPQIFADIPDTLPDSLYTQNRHTSAFVLFLEATEADMIARMKRFLRDELGCRALVTDRSAWANFAADQVPRSELFDYVDDHFYVDHPEFIEQPWRLPSKCANVNPIRNTAMGAQPVVFTRLLDKPFTITEYNYSGPGRFRGVGGIVTGTMGALQDWSGIWRFTYSHDRANMLNPAGYAINYFDMAGDPLSLAAERATLCLFLRGDLAPLAHTYAMVLPKDKVLQMGDALPMNRTEWSWLAWYTRLGTLVTDAPPTGATWSGRYPEIYQTPSAAITKQIADSVSGALPPAGDGSVALDRETGTFVLKTPRTCGGFAESGFIAAGDLIADVGTTAATVWVSSLDGKSIRDSGHLLLTHLTDVQNTGIRYAQRSLKTLLAWGGLPHLVRNGKADVRLAVKSAEAYKVYALSTGGRRLGERPTRVVKGRLAFNAAVDASPETATLLYEIVRE